MMPNVWTMVIGPVAGAVAAGWLLQRWRRVDAAPLARAGVEVFSPALLLAHVPRDLAQRGHLFLLAVGSVLLVLAIAGLIARLLGIRDREELTGFVLGAGLSNFGFVGLPLVQFAWGEPAFATGMALVTFLNIPTGLLSVYMTAPQRDAREAVRHTLSVPFTWAVIASMVVGLSGTQLPIWVTRPLDLLGSAAIPLMLVVLGIQLSELRLRRVRWGLVGLAVGLRLLVAPALVGAMALAIGLDPKGLDTRCALVQLATPPGMTPLVFLAAVRRDPGFMAATILVGTLASVLTLPMWLYLVG